MLVIQVAKEETKKVNSTKKNVTTKNTKIVPKKVNGTTKTVSKKKESVKLEVNKKTTQKKENNTKVSKKDNIEIKKPIKKKRRLKRNVKYYFVEIIFIILMLISLYKIVCWINDNNKNNDALNKSYNYFKVIKKSDKEEYKIDFEGLKKQNSDVVAWIKMDDTKVNYPVLKTTNNDYYISYNLNKEYSEAGWIFADYKNNVDGNDRNLVIYGHGRLDGSMFGSLRDTLSLDWQKKSENHFIKFFTENEELTYQVFSTYKIKVEDYYINTYLDDDNEYLDFLNTIKSRSYYDYGVELNIEDKILTLSTCDIDSNYRIVVHAKKVVNN